MNAKSFRTTAEHHRVLKPASIIRQVFAVCAIAAALLLCLPHGVQAAAIVTTGEVIAPGFFPFYTVPGDPYVELNGDFRIEACVVTDASGGVHFLGKALNEVSNATVLGTTFDYEFVGMEQLRAGPNELPSNGLYASTIAIAVSFLRKDPVTAAPLALINGTGLLGIVQQGGDPVKPGEIIVLLEKIDWKVTPL